MPEPLPAFPTDPGTLDAIEDAVYQHPGSTHITAMPTLDELLELLSGWTPEGDETVHDGARIVDTGPLYSREDVILALITEVRELRARPARREHWVSGQHAPNCPGCAS